MMRTALDSGGLAQGSKPDDSADAGRGFAVPSVRAYLSIEQLALLTPWTGHAIRKMIGRGVFKRNVHYFQPLGRRHGVVFKWSAVVALIEQHPEIEAEPNEPHAQPRSAGMNVQQATADLERLLG